MERNGINYEKGQGRKESGDLLGGQVVSGREAMEIATLISNGLLAATLGIVLRTPEVDWCGFLRH